MQIHLTGPFLIAIAIFILGIILLIFPPRFGNTFFGPRIKSALNNEESWKIAQRLNAFLYIILGTACSVYYLYDSTNHAIIMLLLVIFVQRAGWSFIDGMLEKKYPPQEESKEGE